MIHTGPRWYIAQAAPGYEEQVRGRLSAAKYRVFYPETRKWVTVAKQKVEKIRPLYGRYVFVEIDHDAGQNFNEVRNTFGIVGWIDFGGSPIAVPSEWVSDLMYRQLKGEFDAVENAPLPIHAQVRIMAGRFMEELGVIVGLGRMATVKLKGRNQYVKVLKSDLRPARVA